MGMVAYSLNDFLVDKCSMGDKGLGEGCKDGGCMMTKLRGRMNDKWKDEWEEIGQACYEGVLMANQ
jgi:hypothetical protein